MSLEQYYTEEGIGERLASMLPPMTPLHCIELSAGEGALLLPIVRMWPNIGVTTCELDPENVSKLKSSFKGEHYNIDVLSESFEAVFTGRFSGFDFAVSNPPFSWRKLSAYDISVLERFELLDVFSGSRVRSEVLFILQYVRLMADSACVAFILPELIICSAALAKFRSRLLRFCNVFAVAEISSGAFKGTEAKTYILILKKGELVNNFIYTDISGVSVVKKQADFHLGLKEVNIECQPLADSDEFSIKRGQFSGKECRLLGLPYYHTSGFSDSAKGVIPIPLKSTLILGKKVLVATKGDILISRVGSRVVGRAVVVGEGEYLVSDCVFRVRFSSSVNSSIFLKYWMDHCFSRVVSQARGTCAKYITMRDLTVYLREFLQLNNQGCNSAVR
ncbi:hypothetical protein PS914_03534 [Pseudomonas fluorescens]|uniref:N-6 DNA methylase n=1 Tax=Pseudomonas fluorescens TaxID=294 RepID=UPI00124080A4|nr:N-6 DNA methylase [Pseudomonas fluorescens]VVP95476.1 hypothetical protein PS914_03534 [Pseudomonas fluorescens]